MVIIALLLDDEASSDERAKAVKTGEAFLAKHCRAITRECIRETMFGPKVLPPDLAEAHSSYEDWAKWAKQQIDPDQNAEERK